MLRSRVKKNLLCTVIAGAAALGAVGSGQAAVYTGSWDPAFGSSPSRFSNLGWSGTSTFSIPDTCDRIGTVTCLGMTAGFALVDLYQLGNASHNEILNFNQTVHVSSMTFNGGQLVGVNSDIFTPLLATLSDAGGGAYSFSLQFSSLHGAKLFYLKNDTADSDESGDDSNCILANITSNTQICGVNDFKNYPATVTYTLAVPEPATFALVLAGLGALGLTMRRRRG